MAPLRRSYALHMQVRGSHAALLQGWLFNICDDQQRCVSDPTLGLAVWFRQLWRVSINTTHLADACLRRWNISDPGECSRWRVIATSTEKIVCNVYCLIHAVVQHIASDGAGGQRSLRDLQEWPSAVDADSVFASAGSRLPDRRSKEIPAAARRGVV
jgi:hypothetical protein